PVRDLVAVMATRDGAERVGARITLSIRPELRAPLSGFRGEIFASASAWVRQDGQACALVEHDDEFAEGARFAFGPDGARCAMSRSAVGRVEGVAVGFDSGASQSLTYPGPSVDTVALIAGTGGGAVMVRDPERGALVVLEGGGDAQLFRVLPDHPVEQVGLGAASLASAALDRVWNRALILYFDDGWRLVRARWVGPPELAPHAGVRSLDRTIVV